MRPATAEAPWPLPCLQEHHHHQLRPVGGRVGREPAERRAGAGLAGHRHLGIEGRAGAALVDRACEAVAQALEPRALGQPPALGGREALGAADLRLEHDAAVHGRREQHGELQRRGRDPLRVAREVADRAGLHELRHAARRLPGEVDARRLAQAQQVRVALHLLVPELLAHPLEVGVARDRERALEVDRPVARPHPAALAAAVGGVGRDHAFGEPGDPDDDLEHRAGLERPLHPERRVHERVDAPGARVHRDDGALRLPETAASRLADREVPGGGARRQDHGRGRRHAPRARRGAALDGAASASDTTRPSVAAAAVPVGRIGTKAETSTDRAGGSAAGPRRALWTPARARKINRSKKQGESRCALQSFVPPSSSP